MQDDEIALFLNRLHHCALMEGVFVLEGREAL